MSSTNRAVIFKLPVRLPRKNNFGLVVVTYGWLRWRFRWECRWLESIVYSVNTLKLSSYVDHVLCHKSIFFDVNLCWVIDSWVTNYMFRNFFVSSFTLSHLLSIWYTMKLKLSIHHTTKSNRNELGSSIFQTPFAQCSRRWQIFVNGDNFCH